MSFQGELAEIYDLIYRDKDYEAECDFIEVMFRSHASKKIRTILDGGCGTGGHAVPLAKRGYQVSGIDSSEGMIRRAKINALEANLNLDFEVRDLRRFDLNRKFDACLCMFAVVGYITETDDLLQSLRNIRKHLNKGALFIFDAWNGPAVLKTKPSVRVKVIRDAGRKIIRIAQPETDIITNRCLIHYHTLVTQGDRIEHEFEEDHLVRYFFPLEITHYLTETGFEVRQMCPFLDQSGKVDENTWNIVTVARAI